ncbi:hypothetical protein [Asaia platycodi]|uniref:hypothetical protein n=1 Tax=Asaia platycodi TaxID=610243 RepID=UPI000A63D300|nr:hypothetical protein [Asaia platycodi]
MKPLDLTVILLYFIAISFLIWCVSRRAGGSSEDFLSGHHDLPGGRSACLWWLPKHPH